MEFKDVKFMAAKEKEIVLKQWKQFIASGFEFKKFTPRLYDHLIQHCSFIAHYNRSGFYSEYFEDPCQTNKFLNQFDRTHDCISVEYGYDGWYVDPDYRDINEAMVFTLAPYLPEIRKALQKKELADATGELTRAQARVSNLAAAYGGG